MPTGGGDGEGAEAPEGAEDGEDSDEADGPTDGDEEDREGRLQDPPPAGLQEALLDEDLEWGPQADTRPAA